MDNKKILLIFLLAVAVIVFFFPVFMQMAVPEINDNLELSHTATFGSFVTKTADTPISLDGRRSFDIGAYPKDTGTPSEMVTAQIVFHNLPMGGKCTIGFYEMETGRKLFSLTYDIPSPQSQGFDYWEWYFVYAYIGHFTGEIEKSGLYFAHIEGPEGPGGGRVLIPFEVTGVPIEPEKAFLYLTPNVEKCNVYLDDKLLGVTNTVGYWNIYPPFENRELRVEKEGYWPWTMTVNFKSGTVQVYSPTLREMGQPCPFECCEGIAGYQDKLCSEGYLCVNEECIYQKQPCPFECCIDEEQYFDKACLEGFECTNRICIEIPECITSADCPENYLCIAEECIYQKQPCPFECCEGEELYLNKSCPIYEKCFSRICQAQLTCWKIENKTCVQKLGADCTTPYYSTKEECEAELEEPEIFGIILIIAIFVVAAIYLLLLISGKLKK